MHRSTLRRSLVAAAIVSLAVAGCTRSDDETDTTAPASPMAAPETTAPETTAPAEAPFRVTSVEVGSAIGPDKRISAPATTFVPTDTIYVSVASDGTADSVTLTARWTYEDGQVVDETSQEIEPAGPAASEFHIDMPDGLPTGRYQVEVLADGRSVETEEFDVR
jgi:hypothetical protein